jgi:hypothetical protein
MDPMILLSAFALIGLIPGDLYPIYFDGRMRDVRNVATMFANSFRQ